MNHQTTSEAPPPDTTALSALLALGQVPERYPKLFPSVESLRWYMREHREGLVEAGALHVIRGRTYIAPGPFEAYVLRAGQEQAAKRRLASARVCGGA